MKTRGTALAGVLLTTITTAGLGVATAPSAHAAREVVVDEAGDTTKNRLDITHVTLRNNDRRIVARVEFAREVAGDLIVSVDPRRDTGIRLIAERKRDGSVRSSVLPGAFTDREGDDATEPTCTDLKVRWRGTVARLALPSRCLHDGDYGALRFSVLTENGGDSDYAPETETGATGWVARG
ncbi:hypothetical protein GHK92_18275 [Nocardioides sp. dk4132]|uniref:hypothetical protein n=1 Tax=unclassified Nocardioides TaxID=2615069 RepID=UPI001294CFE8|nr:MULTISPECIES: hypothetical protein [unclassified Nocardioides]MQW77822.1 hypothetical protein [Nocardioides sp. dk4132]QGA08216.1 hypothetical protein GFH29_12980 [Nocardioides sp. dk884]